MKKPIMAMTTALGMLTLGGLALAMEPSLPRTPKVFAKLDSNADGKITLAEIQSKAEKRFLKLDGDNNGEVTTAEIDAALQKALENRRRLILKRMDADGNGTVSKAELDQFIIKLIETADADSDGGVTRDEARNFRVAKFRKPATGESIN
jgi:Ca2+-binding EF-hand superfamily protein